MLAGRGRSARGRATRPRNRMLANAAHLGRWLAWAQQRASCIYQQPLKARLELQRRRGEARARTRPHCGVCAGRRPERRRLPGPPHGSLTSRRFVGCSRGSVWRHSGSHTGSAAANERQEGPEVSAAALSSTRVAAVSVADGARELNSSCEKPPTREANIIAPEVVSQALRARALRSHGDQSSNAGGGGA